MSLHFWSQPRVLNQKSLMHLHLILTTKIGCNLHISVAYVKLVWSHYTWYNLSLDREGVKHSGTCMHACFIHAWMVWTQHQLYPIHIYVPSKKLLCVARLQLHQWHKTFVNNWMHEQQILWALLFCEQLTWSRNWHPLFDLHYKTRALWIGFTDNPSSKFKHKVWLRHIYTFSIDTKRSIVYIITETWNANTAW